MNALFEFVSTARHLQRRRAAAERTISKSLIIITGAGNVISGRALIESRRKHSQVIRGRNDVAATDIKSDKAVSAQGGQPTGITRAWSLIAKEFDAGAASLTTKAREKPRPNGRR